jgi:hypothetical protein
VAEVKARLLRRNWWLPGLAAAVLPASLLLGWLNGATTAYGVLASAMGLSVALACLVRNPFPQGTPVRLRATGGSLEIGDAPAIFSDEIAEAKVVMGEQGKPEVRLSLRDGSARWLRLEHPSDADALLSTMGIGPGGRRARFLLVVPFGKRFLVALLCLGLPWLAWASPAWGSGLVYAIGFCLLFAIFCVAPVCAVLAVIAGVIPGSLVVGRDGFTVRAPLRARFVPFSEVIGLDADTLWTNRFAIDTIVSLRGGKKLRLSARDAPTTSAGRGAEAAAMHSYLVGAHAQSQVGGGVGSDTDALLSRMSDGSGAAWLASIDAVARGGSERYRVATLSEERLAEIVDDPEAPAEARAGAAAALLRRGDETGDETGRTAVRIATNACADPSLRAALLALEEAADDDAFATALEKARTAPVASKQ